MKKVDRMADVSLVVLNQCNLRAFPQMSPWLLDDKRRGNMKARGHMLSKERPACVVRACA